MIESFCKQHGLALMGRIPFDSKAVRAVNNGQTIVDIDCESGTAVKAIYNKTTDLLFKEGSS